MGLLLYLYLQEVVDHPRGEVDDETVWWLPSEIHLSVVQSPTFD